MYLQLNTQFNPFTYKEMVEPLAYYKQAYDEVQQAYDAITDDAEALQTIVNEEDSPIAYGTYNRYMYELNNALDSFGQGLTPGTRRRLSRLRGRFNSDIKPIANAYQRKLTLQDEQRKAEGANPTMLWQRKASDMSLDDIIANPTIDYGGSYSGAAITQQVANMAAQLSKEAQEGEQGKTTIKQLLPYQYETLSRSGFSSDAIMAAIINSPDAPQILTNMVEGVIDSTGIRGWNNPEALQRAYDYARQGLYNAIGETTRNVVTDQAGLAAYKAQLDDMNNQRQFNRQLQAAKAKGNGDGENSNNKRLIPRSFISADPKVTKYASTLKSLTDKDGKFQTKYFGPPVALNNWFVNPITFRDGFSEWLDEKKPDLTEQHYSLPMQSYNKYSVVEKNNQTSTYSYLNLFLHGSLSYDTLSQEAKDVYNQYLRDNGLPSYIRPISDEQYDALKYIDYKGLESGDTFSYSDFESSIDKMGQMKTYWSTAMSNYDWADGQIKYSLGFWDQADNFNQKVYKVKGDGEIGEAVDYDDLKLTGENANSVTNISYYPFQPDYLMVTIGGNNYYMEPEVLGDTMANIIRQSSNLIRSLDDNATPEDIKIAGENTTSAIVNLLNNYNQTLPKTSSNAVE